MNKKLKISAALILGCCMLSSCYSYTAVVGKGAQGKERVTKWNHYFIDGLIPGDVSDSKTMAGEATDYSIFTRQTFVNGLIAGITFGLYTPTTTTVTK